MDILTQIQGITQDQWAKIVAGLTAVSLVIGIARHFLKKGKNQTNKVDIKNAKESNIDINQKNN